MRLADVGARALAGLLPAVLVAPQYLAGAVEFGVVKQAQDAFMVLITGGLWPHDCARAQDARC